MNILYIGDIMGKPGREVVEKILPKLKKQHKIDFTIAQGENVSHGKGLKVAHLRELQTLGVDFFTGGNHTFAQEEIFPLLEKADEPVIRPANYPEGTPGKGWKLAKTQPGNVLVISLLGQIVGKDADVVVDNPLQTVDKILEAAKDVPKVATVVNFHGDYSSEKVVIGHYLDGKVSAVIGDHWHVPTADARVLPGGTAHISDVGMVGALNSSLGIKSEIIQARWHGSISSRNELEDKGPYQFCAVIIGVDEVTGLARGIEQVIEHIS